MPETTPPDSHGDLVCGVARDLVERFLVLVRDNYPKADNALYFFQEHAGVTHTIVTTNLRDVLSHLATMLASDTPDDQREGQIVTAEEHFRRAIQEPCAIAIGKLRQSFKPLYEEYKRTVLPRKGQHQELRAAPDVMQITETLQEIAGLAAEGRAAKRRNRIDSQWDHGVGSHHKAYAMLSKLHTELEKYCHLYKESRRRRRQLTFNIIGVIGTVGTLVFGILSLAFLLKPELAEAFRKALGIG